MTDSLNACARAPLARDLPRVAWRPSAAALAPSDLVVGREGWGARDPGKICGSVVEPYRVSVHHTASPETLSTAERMPPVPAASSSSASISSIDQPRS